MSDQARALRVRTFMNYLNLDTTRGAYVYIGIPAAELCANGTQPADFPTTLRRVTTEEFDRIANHGFAVACASQE
jgi:NTE family protein